MEAHGEVVEEVTATPPELNPTQEVPPLTKEEVAELENANDAAIEAQAEAEVEEDNKQNNSVVQAKFKDKYLNNARALGIKGKAAKRSNWDWLSQQIAAVCLGEKDKIRIADFKALLDANGVDHSRWTNTNKGWEGRFRMTGRVALQKVVANNNLMKFPDFMSVTQAVPPPDFVARFKTKE
jgi:hypothetical protein